MCKKDFPLKYTVSILLCGLLALTPPKARSQQFDLDFKIPLGLVLVGIGGIIIISAGCIMGVSGLVKKVGSQNSSKSSSYLRRLKTIAVKWNSDKSSQRIDNLSRNHQKVVTRVIKELVISVVENHSTWPTNICEERAREWAEEAISSFGRNKNGYAGEAEWRRAKLKSRISLEEQWQIINLENNNYQ